ncbi:MAG: long-chain fatty acid--CoA ligase [Alphaproteobacteria bacterium]|nr:MAG: long-chain fatty acid--CoA ligase [Alphaproteobacteria bacterium]
MTKAQTLSQVSMDLSNLGSIHNLLNQDRWSGPQIKAAVTARADVLRRHGIGPGSNIIIAHGGSPAFFVDLFAAWLCGACASCTNQALTDAELINVAGFTDSEAILLGDRALPETDAGLTWVEGLPERTGEDQGALIISAPKDAHALILFTSGTTGDPKGVVHSFGTLRARIDNNHDYISPQTMARTLCVLPTHFGHGLIGNCLTPLLAGGDLFLASGGGLQVAARLGTFLQENQITFMSSVPAFWKIALKASKAPEAKTLHQVHIGSAPVAADLIREIAAWTGTQDVRNMYGITETANWVAGGSLRDREPEDGLIGPMWGGEAAVALPDGSIAPQGEGEILLKPPSLMLGYLKRSDLTTEVIKEGWYYTGDTGTIDAQGVIRLTGRIKNEINRGGMKVSPEEIDLLLERHDSVLEACAFGLPDPVAGETVAVALVFKEGRTEDPKTLRDWAISHIRRECVPERWFILNEIPKTDRGKLNRDTVRKVCLERA